MSKDAETLFDAAIALPEDDRATLVMRIFDSIGTTPDADAAQAAESVDRLDAIRRGELDVLDDEAAMRLIAG